MALDLHPLGEQNELHARHWVSSGIGHLLAPLQEASEGGLATAATRIAFLMSRLCCPSPHTACLDAFFLPITLSPPSANSKFLPCFLCQLQPSAHHRGPSGANPEAPRVGIRVFLSWRPQSSGNTHRFKAAPRTARLPEFLPEWPLLLS